MKHDHHGNSWPQGRSVTSLWRHQTCRPVFGRYVVKACRCRLWHRRLKRGVLDLKSGAQRCHQTWMAGKFMNDIDGLKDVAIFRLIQVGTCSNFHLLREPPIPARHLHLSSGFPSQQRLTTRRYVDPQISTAFGPSCHVWSFLKDAHSLQMIGVYTYPLHRHSSS